MRVAFLLGVAALSPSVPPIAAEDAVASAEMTPKLAYPETKKTNVTEEQFA